jgi:hypothetical protein
VNETRAGTLGVIIIGHESDLVVQYLQPMLDADQLRLSVCNLYGGWGRGLEVERRKGLRGRLEEEWAGFCFAQRD